MVTIGNNNFLTIEEIADGFNVKVDKVYEILKEYNIKTIKFDTKIYILENEFLKLFTEEAEIYIENIYQNNKRKYPITEKEILTETISLLQNTGQISIKELREILKERMDLSEEDLRINKHRNDTKFDQKVRNLISHRKNNGLTKYCEYEKIGREGFLKLKGEEC